MSQCIKYFMLMKEELDAYTFFFVTDMKGWTMDGRTAYLGALPLASAYLQYHFFGDTEKN